MRVLVVEDDADLRIAVEVSLRGDGFAVDVAADLPAADEAISVNVYDCAVFDRMLPAGDAIIDVAARRRAGWHVPVLFLTARDTLADKLAGFDHGGDDYLVKPFQMAEFLARVRALCWRTGTDPAPVLRHADLEIDTGRREARRDGAPLTLTPKEYAVLTELLAAAGQPVPRARLLAAAWDELVQPNANALDVLIRQLRTKIGGTEVLRTVRGVGYLLAPETRYGS